MARFYTVKQTALILGFSTNSIYKFLEEGRLKGTRGNAAKGRFKIAHSSLEQFLGSKLPEDALSAAVLKHQKAPTKKEITPVINNHEASSESLTSLTNTTNTQSAIPQSLARFLIIVALIGILLDLILNQNYSFTQNGLRLVLLTIIILLTYQYGGVTLTK